MSTTVQKQKYTAKESNLSGLRGTALRCVGGSRHGQTMTIAKDFSGNRIEVLVPNPSGIGLGSDGRPLWGAGSRAEFYKAVYVPTADFGPERLTGGRLFDVSSTAIKSIRFVRATPPGPGKVAALSTTEIETTTGGVYQYRGASLDDVLDFLSASSKGRHYNNVWKPKFGHTSVKVEV